MDKHCSVSDDYFVFLLQQHPKKKIRKALFKLSGISKTDLLELEFHLVEFP
jgi:hypothetical protein